MARYSKAKRRAKRFEYLAKPGVIDSIRKKAIEQMLRDPLQLKNARAVHMENVRIRQLSKPEKQPSKKMILAWQRILDEAEDLEKQGFRVIPITNVVPDIIAIKDGKVFAVEVEYNVPNYAKYTDAVKSYFDDVIWLLKGSVK